MVDLINLFEVSFYFNAKYSRLGFGFDYWGKVHFANVMVQQPFSFTHNESSNQEPWTCRCDICHDHLCCLQQGTEKVDRGTACVRAVKRNVALWPLKAHFLCCHGDFFANELNRWTIKYCQMQRRELFLCLIKSWPTLQLEYLGMPHVTVSGT